MADAVAKAADELPVIALRGISKSFGAVQALDEVDLDIYPDEVVAIVGDNGAGKSTFIKILAGVHPPSAGQILYGADPVTIPSPAAGFGKLT